MKKRIPIYLLNSVHYQPKNIALSSMKWWFICIVVTVSGGILWLILDTILDLWR